MTKTTYFTVIGGIVLLLMAAVLSGQKGCVTDNDDVIEEDDLIAQKDQSVYQGSEPVTQSDISSIRTNIVRKTSIDWEVINIDISTALSVTLRRGYPRGVPEGRTLIGDQEAEEVARDFLLLLKDELYISSVSDITIDEIRLNNSITVNYHQDFKDVPVYDSLGLISMTQYGEIYTLKHIWYPNIAVPTIIPAISMVNIKKMALEHYEVDNIDFFEEPKLYVLSPDKLVWLVKMGEPVHKNAIMDALTGSVLSERSNLMREPLRE